MRRRARVKVETKVFVEGKEKKDYELVYGSESSGSKSGSTGVLIFVLRDPETRAAQEQLDDDDVKSGGRLTPYEQERHWFSGPGREVEKLLSLQAARLDPKVAEGIEAKKEFFAKCFTDAGLGPIFMEAVENQYWPDSYADLRYANPWYRVTTPVGVIEIGWRKSVINIDWSRTILRSLIDEQYGDGPGLPKGKELFPEIEKANFPTLGDTYVHAYGYEKATEYLKVLAEWNLRVLQERAKQKREAKEPLKWSDEQPK